MYSQLIIKAFEKAGSEIHTSKATPIAKHLSDHIEKLSKEPYGERRLRDYYTAAKKGDPIDLKKFVANALSVYLGYENFEAFVKANPSQPESKKPFYKRYKWPLAGGLLLILVVLGYHQLTQQRWMVWQENQYVEVKFDDKLLQEGKLKLYNEDRINNFKKIKVVCNTTYKTPDGKALVWYGKNTAGELEYFTSHGLHPETGKTLKELSKYMFDKYGCPNASN